MGVSFDQVWRHHQPYVTYIPYTHTHRNIKIYPISSKPYFVRGLVTLYVYNIER